MKSTRAFPFIVVVLIAASTLIPIDAQVPAPTSPADRLPVRRVVLYKSGIGYFEHLGRVRGNQDVTIEFTSSQLDDVLKSLTALDLDGGRVASVNYNSDAGVDRRLNALRLSLGPSATRAQLLTALRGARVEARTGATRITGRLLSVEQQERRVDSAVITVDALSIVTDTGDIQTVVLDQGVTVRILEADLNAEVGRYLSIISSSREQDVRRLTISAAGQGERDLFVSYVSEVPVWKSTYRLVLGTEAAGAKPSSPMLQGWAIVDNTIGEDWNNVELSLVAGAPQAFIQRISQPYYVQRPVVPLPERVLSAPQTHQGSLVTAGAGGVAGFVRDSSGGVLPGVTVRVSRNGVLAGSAVTDERGAYRVTGLSAGSYDIALSLTGFRPAMANGVRVAAGLEVALSHTLEVGAMTEQLSVSAPAPLVDTRFDGGSVAGGGGGGRGGGRGGPGGGRGRGGPGRGGQGRDRDESGVESAVVRIYRCSKVVKGGRTFSFGALVVAGDRRGNIGIGYGKANEVPPAVEKATKDARKSMFKINLKGTTIPHQVQGFSGASKVVLVPARPGTGVTAGKSVRPCLELAGITDILSKAYGSTSPKNLVKATIAALRALQSKEQVERIRGTALGAGAGELD